eukprot:gene10172-12478_t
MSTSINVNDIRSGYDVIVVGGGVAGSAFAYSLGHKGLKVLCFERDLSEPDRIVGELMQPGGVQQLREIGMEDCFEGIDASTVHGYGIFKKGKGVKLSYPKDRNGAIINGWSFHHGRFVQKLRQKAMTAPNVDMVEATVKSLIEEDGVVKGVNYTENDVNKEIRAPLTIVCDGCFSNFRKALITETPTFSSSFIGLIIKGCQLPYQSHGHIGSDEIRVLVDVPGKCPSGDDLKAHLENVTAPQLPDTLREAFLNALANDTIKKMPNNRLHPQSISKPGVILVGDSWNMRHPLTGAGMTVALQDVNILSKLLPTCNLNDHHQVSNMINLFLQKRKPLASTLNVLAGALYQVFSANNEHLRNACLGYLDLGFEFSAGPVALLSGLKPKPHILAIHFFAVAFYGVMKTIFPFPTPSRIYLSYKILCAASDIVVPLLRKEGVLKYLTFLCVALRLTK